MTNEQKKPHNEVEVMIVYDWHDEQDFLEVVREMGANGGAHIYVIDPDDDFGGTFIVSSRPMSQHSAQRTFYADQREQAREALKQGDSPEDVWNTYRVSAAAISRICKEEGIKTPYRWFATALKSAEAERVQTPTTVQ